METNDPAKVTDFERYDRFFRLVSVFIADWSKYRDNLKQNQRYEPQVILR